LCAAFGRNGENELQFAANLGLNNIISHISRTKCKQEYFFTHIFLGFECTFIEENAIGLIRFDGCYYGTYSVEFVVHFQELLPISVKISENKN
jgi:hypothetical protein